MHGDDANDWCVVRTQPAQTLGLAEALGEAGLRAWTPTEIVVRRARRQIPRKEVTVALMPGMVFVGWSGLTELLELSRAAMTYRVWDQGQKRMVVRGVPFFRILRLGDRYARLGDRDLQGLRSAESKRSVAVKRRMLQPGTTVRMTEGAFEGLRGTVESVRGTFAQVRFDDWKLSVAIALHLLDEERVP